MESKDIDFNTNFFEEEKEKEEEEEKVPSDFLDSSNVATDLQHRKFIYNHFGDRRIKMILLYSGTRDGFNSDDFHSRADNKGPTLSLF